MKLKSLIPMVCFDDYVIISRVLSGEVLIEGVLSEIVGDLAMYDNEEVAYIGSVPDKYRTLTIVVF